MLMISQNAFLKSWSKSERATTMNKNPFNKTFFLVWIIYHFCIENDFFHVGGKLLLAFYFFLPRLNTHTQRCLKFQQVHSNDIFRIPSIYNFFFGFKIHPDLDWLYKNKTRNILIWSREWNKIEPSSDDNMTFGKQ